MTLFSNICPRIKICSSKTTPDRSTGKVVNSFVYLVMKEKLIRFLCTVHMKISKAFYEWKKKNKDMLSEDRMATLCDKATVKLMSQEFKLDSTLSKIRSIMYGKMKTDMKALVEYEFEF